MLTLLIAAAITAAPPAVDTDAVYRRGNSVEATDEFTDAIEAVGASALAPPPDDSNKWYVSIITMQGCAPCERLKADFVSSPHLRCFANPLDRANSWAHYNVYHREDATQAARWRNLKIDGFPVILVQPPMDGSYGKPSTVVFQQCGYDGDPQKLGQSISEAITEYVGRLRWQGNEAGALVPVGFTDVSATRPGPSTPFPVPQPVNPLPDGYNPHQPQPYGPSPYAPSPNPSPLVVVPPRTPATIDQLRAAIPGAPADFLLEAVQRQLTIEEALAAWQQIQPVLPLDPAIPIPLPRLPAVQPWMIYAAIGLAIGYYLYRQKQKEAEANAAKPAARKRAAASKK